MSSVGGFIGSPAFGNLLGLAGAGAGIAGTISGKQSSAANQRSMT